MKTNGEIKLIGTPIPMMSSPAFDRNPNSGKTTMLKAIMKYAGKDAGEILEEMGLETHPYKK